LLSSAPRSEQPIVVLKPQNLPKVYICWPFIFIYVRTHIHIYANIFLDPASTICLLSIAGYSSFFLLVDGLVAWYICFSGSFLFSFNAKMFPTELIILGANQRLPTAALLYPYIPESLNFQHSLYFSTLCSIYIYTHSTVFYLRRASS